MTPPNTLTIEEIRTVVKETVQETLTGLGIDTDNPQEMQANFIYLGKSRKGSEEIARWAKRSAIGVAVSATIWAIWTGIKTLF